MEKHVIDHIWAVQEKLAADPQYAQLLREYRIRNSELLIHLETMTVSQQDAVMDFLGVLIEIQMKILELLAGSGAGR